MARAKKLALAVIDDGDRAEAIALLERIYSGRNRKTDGRVHVPSTISADALAWLDERGLAPNQLVTWSHDDIVRAVRGARVTVRAGAAAFVASLDGGPPHGAYLEAAQLAQALPVHEGASHGRAGEGRGEICGVCGLPEDSVVDLTDRWLDWQRAGSGIPGDLVAARIALAQWQPATPSDRATSTLARILVTLDGQPRTAGPTQAIRAVHALGVFSSGDLGLRGWSQSVVETLAFAGVLEAPPHVGMATRFVSFLERDQRPTVRTEVDAPLGFWRARNGVTWANAVAVFGLDRASARELASAWQRPTIASRAIAKVKQQKVPSVRGHGLARRPPKPGDAWGLRIREDFWIGMYVWTVTKRRDRAWACVEYLDWHGEEAPTASDLEDRGVRPRASGDRWQMEAHTLEKTPGIILVAEGVAAPAAKIKFDGPRSAGKDLIHLADWCFAELDA